MSAAPRLSIGLPVYNGEEQLAETLEALLGQSYGDFELIISDNASTDSTADICHSYGRQDSRIRYIRQPRNIGRVPNHNFLIEQARGELFKWAAGDDLYARDLLKRCVDALDENPQVVLAHAGEGIIDESGAVISLVHYPVATDAPRAPDRFRSMLFDGWGDDSYGIVRTEVLRRTPLHGSYHLADRTFTTELALHGPFYQVPEWLFFRRDAPARTADDPGAVRVHGPVPGKPVALPGCAPVRRVRLGLHRDDPAGAADGRRTAGMLRPSSALGGRAGLFPVAYRSSAGRKWVTGRRSTPSRSAGRAAISVGALVAGQEGKAP